MSNVRQDVGFFKLSQGGANSIFRILPIERQEHSGHWHFLCILIPLQQLQCFRFDCFEV